MMKAKDLQNSVWQDETGDFMEVTKEAGTWIARGQSYSIESKSAREIQTKLKEDGFTFLGWD
jgi:hypothetical protein